MSYLTPSWIRQLINSCQKISMPSYCNGEELPKSNSKTPSSGKSGNIDRQAISSACNTLCLSSAYRTQGVEVRYPMYLYIPPSPSEIPRLMNSLFSSLSGIKQKTNIYPQEIFGVFTAILSIHPLRDGNGRLSREIFKRMAAASGQQASLLMSSLDEIHRGNGYLFRAVLCEIQTPTPDFTCHTEFMNECIRRAVISTMIEGVTYDGSTIGRG